METSALESLNVEAAFNTVLTGSYCLFWTHHTVFTCTLHVFLALWVSPLQSGLKSCKHFIIIITLSLFDLLLSEIHKKVSSKEVTRGSINAVTLSQPKAAADDAQKEKKACCKNLWRNIAGLLEGSRVVNSACTVELSLRKKYDIKQKEIHFFIDWQPYFYC